MPPVTDPYVVLGLKRGAPLKAVKARYRELARQHHPDKQHGATDAERARHEERFKEVTTAYHVIEELERDGTAAFTDEAGDHGRWHAMWARVEAMFRNKDMWSRVGEVFKDIAKSATTHTVEVAVTLEDIYLRKKRKLRLFLNGITEPVYVTVDAGDFPEVTLPYTPKESAIEHTIRIVMHDSPHAVFTLGDILGTLDLYVEVKLTWAEFIHGARREFTYLDGTPLTVDIPAFYGQKCMVVPARGIRGDLYVCIDVVAPSQSAWEGIGVEQRADFCKILAALETHQNACA